MAVASSFLTPYRALASLFSRDFFISLLHHNDLTHLVSIAQHVGCGRSKCETAMDYLEWAYSCLLRYYPCEYIYKNEFLNRVVLKKRLGNDCVVMNEFRVAGSIADFAVFGEKSEVFEIKTSLDSPKRLTSQVKSYLNIFQSVSLVVPIEEVERYIKIAPENVGIVAMFNDALGINYEELRPATVSKQINPQELVKVLHTAEYRQVVQNYFGTLPLCSDLKMYFACAKKMSQIPSETLQEILLESMKHRKKTLDAMALLRQSPRVLRQVCFAMGFSATEIDKIREKLAVCLEI